MATDRPDDNARAAPDAVGAALQSALVWVAAAPAGQQAHVAFRRVVELAAAPAAAAVHLFADSRYILWVNGAYVERGPCRFDPQQPEYDTLDVTGRLRAGANVLAVVAHHFHDGLADDDPTPMNGRLMRHAPAMGLRLDLTGPGGRVETLTTDGAWRATLLRSHRPVPPSWGGLPDDVDARLEPDGWTTAGFDDGEWECPLPVDGRLWGPLRPRALPLLRETEVVPARVIRLPAHAGPLPRTLAEVLPATLEAGEEIVVDVGRSVLAYDLVDLEAPGGTGIEVAHGHGCIDGRPDEVHLTNRYVARPGRQVYRSGDTVGYRYLLLRVTAGRVTLHGLRAVNRVYPFDRVGRFACSDPFLNELWERGLTTVELCSEDGYTDCSGRERVEWMGDAAICGYPVTRVALAGPPSGAGPRWADPRLLRNMLRHVAQSQQPDGRLKAHHPSNRWDIHGYIEDYACLWVQALRAYHAHTADLALVREMWPALVRQLAWFLERRTPRGLVTAREFVFVDNPLCYQVCEGTTLNASVAGALANAAALGALLGMGEAASAYAAAAADLAAAIDRHLWDAQAGTYGGAWGADGPSPPTLHAAVLALYHGIVPEARRDSVRRWVAAHLDEAGSPYTAHFLFEVLSREGTPELERAALQFVRDKWARVLARRDHETVTEGFGPASLCHNIGAVPVYYLSTCVLGVRWPAGLTEDTVLVEPHLGELQHASGVVVTELGPVAVAWQRDALGAGLAFTCELPGTVSAVLRLPVPGATARILIDGQGTVRHEVHAGRATLRLGPGRHRGRVEAG